ncbi:hypothetical protein AVEN_150500-1 [Araneus ventricosus]|uniref:Uncharacterized protein n=1 Tax=Araneus ventricosus TaxID=182803 RepID=A0A4Y2HL60_ARAVE|nr:hypothetical protein AVEN_150500-1 [Araneus ventricosus]
MARHQAGWTTGLEPRVWWSIGICEHSAALHLSGGTTGTGTTGSGGNVGSAGTRNHRQCRNNRHGRIDTKWWHHRNCWYWKYRLSCVARSSNRWHDTKWWYCGFDWNRNHWQPRHNF